MLITRFSITWMGKGRHCNTQKSFFHRISVVVDIRR